MCQEVKTKVIIKCAALIIVIKCVIVYTIVIKHAILQILAGKQKYCLLGRLATILFVYLVLTNEKEIVDGYSGMGGPTSVNRFSKNYDPACRG